MVNLLGRVFEARLDVLTLKVGIAFEDLGLGGPGREHFEHVFYADAHAPDTRPSGALFGVKRDSVHLAHARKLRTGFAVGKRVVAVIFRLGPRRELRTGMRRGVDKPSERGSLSRSRHDVFLLP